MQYIIKNKAQDRQKEIQSTIEREKKHEEV